MPNGAHVIDIGFHRGAAIEDVDIAFPAQPFLLEHLQRGPGVLVDLADAVLRRLWQKRHVDRVLRHQLADEALLPQPGELVGLLEFHWKEVAAEAVPERADAVRAEDAAHFRQHLGRETLAELRHEQPARLGEQRAVAVTPVGRAQEQRGDFGVTGVIRTQKQRVDGAMQVELDRRVGQLADTIVVERCLPADFGLDRAAARQLAGLLVLEHEEIEPLRLGDTAFESRYRVVDLGGQELAAVGQRGETDAGFLGQGLQFVDIVVPNGSQAHYSSPSSSASSTLGSASGATSTARPSSTPSNAACSSDSSSWPVGVSA